MAVHEPMLNTSLRLRADQSAALKAEAGRLQTERIARGEPAGKADVSEVIRSILDEWMRGRSPAADKSEPAQQGAAESKPRWEAPGARRITRPSSLAPTPPPAPAENKALGWERHLALLDALPRTKSFQHRGRAGKVTHRGELVGRCLYRRGGEWIARIKSNGRDVLIPVGSVDGVPLKEALARVNKIMASVGSK